MAKFVIRGAEKPEEVVEFWLEESLGGGVFLRARCGGAGKTLCVVTRAGVLARFAGADGLPGLQYDDLGRIKEEE